MSCDPSFLEDLIRQARALGADAADALVAESTSLSVEWRLKKLEGLTREESKSLGLRVFFGKKQASVSTTDFTATACADIVEKACAMARLAPEDPFCGLADPQDLAKSWPDLDLYDGTELSTEALIDLARRAEDATLAVPQVAQCEGTGAQTDSSAYAIVTSTGFSATRRSSCFSLASTAIAGQDTHMVIDGDYSTALHATDLKSPEAIGRSAGERATSRLDARKMPTGQVPIVFDPRAARSLLGHFAGAISGDAIALGTSFLKGSLNKLVFPTAITITDDPFRHRGLRSRPFDAEGIAPQKRALIDQGRLTTWLLDTRSARQLGLKPTGHASRSIGGLPHPSPSNLFIEPTSLTRADLLADIQSGFYVVQVMGQGVNDVTGDYSRAASGFWIENGKITFPVNEMTIAGNLKDMFAHLIAANDLVFETGIDAPTLRIDGMTVAGI